MSIEAIPERPHVPALDGVRGLAIVLVMLFHFSIHFGPPRQYTHFGWCGVDLFFVLSGFLITGILFDTKRNKNYFFIFYIRRVLRIFPLYWIFLFICFYLAPILQWKLPGWPPLPSHGWFWFHASNLYIARHFWTGSISLDPTWSLAVEEQFYLLWPLVVFLFDRRALFLVCGLLVIATISFRFWLDFHRVSPTAIYVLSPARFDSFAVGAAVALALRGRERAIYKPIAQCLLLICGGALGYWWWLDAFHHAHRFVETDPVMRHSGYTVVALFFGALVFLIVDSRERSLLPRLFQFSLLRMFGRYSYALYLFHRPVEMSILHWRIPQKIAAGTGSPALTSFLLVGIAFIVSLSLSWLSWTLYESHFLKLKRFFSYR